MLNWHNVSWHVQTKVVKRLKICQQLLTGMDILSGEGRLFSQNSLSEKGSSSPILEGVRCAGVNREAQKLSPLYNTANRPVHPVPYTNL